jgi:hypothetical protein
LQISSGPGRIDAGVIYNGRSYVSVNFSSPFYSKGWQLISTSFGGNEVKIHNWKGDSSTFQTSSQAIGWGLPKTNFIKIGGLNYNPEKPTLQRIFVGIINSILIESKVLTTAEI